MSNTEIQRIHLTFLKLHQEAELDPPLLAQDHFCQMPTGSFYCVISLLEINE